MARFVYKWHKWLAAGAGLATLLWFVSGVVMVLPANLLVKPPAPAAAKESAPSFKEIRITVPQAIVAAEAGAGGNVEVTSFASRRILDRTLYQIATRKHGTFLIDAMDGTRFEITPTVASLLATMAARDSRPMQEPVLLRKHDSDYRYGPLPAYKIAANDGYGTIFFVTAETGELRSINSMGQVRGFIAGLHTFDFLRSPGGSGRLARVLLLLFGLVGTAMTLFGAWILWLQFRNWQMRRRAA